MDVEDEMNLEVEKIPETAVGTPAGSDHGDDIEGNFSDVNQAK